MISIKQSKGLFLSLFIVVLVLSILPAIQSTDMSLGYSYYSAGRAAYAGNVTDILMAIGGHWLVIASAALVASPGALVIFL